MQHEPRAVGERSESGSVAHKDEKKIVPTCDKMLTDVQ